MATVIVDLSVSLDGFVAGTGDGMTDPLGRGGQALFAWMAAGGEENRVDPRISPPDASVPVVQEWMSGGGAIISGRRTFDIAGGWADGHPIDVPIGGGVRLFDLLPDPITLEQTRVIPSDGVTHLRYRIVKD